MSDNSFRDGDRSFAFAAARHDGSWELHRIPDTQLDSLEDVVSTLRTLRFEGATLGFLCIDDDWIAVLRPTPQGIKILMSDATAALDSDLAADILEELDVDIPTEEEAEQASVAEEAWPEGDFDLLEDLGASEQVLTIIFDDNDLYGAEQLIRIAEELDFVEELAQLIPELDI